jgi:hypothetical protein
MPRTTIRGGDRFSVRHCEKAKTLERDPFPSETDHALRPVEIQDSTFGLVVIQAADGTIRIDGRPMGED